MGGREVSRPYQVGFSPKASGFYPFGDATALAWEGGVGDVVWLIQASASNHKPKPSLWFAKIISLTAIICQPYLLTLQNNMNQHENTPFIRHPQLSSSAKGIA